jgi:gas vesicle protein
MLMQVFILSTLIGGILGFIVADFMAFERTKELSRDLRLSFQENEELREYIHASSKPIRQARG